ncbi:periplasmic divalent manganese/zinc-binding lipoprotein [Geomonas silvestris]|uniref:Periplasmic divalent manganese/zinc-binding lipoprotein n=1 Tax=Geomonas silvestris TaxID=2740184 RepID=A0A6V8MPH6_9BACT|nr:metal ABC transporter substrate-binding protein [Geomonas silvestris]GFO61519.1 periplasmic divalent manganese/zinc-binding lipoprotein [Geomonas silvestris]
MKRALLGISLILFSITLLACQKKREVPVNAKPAPGSRLSVVTTLYPLYDFTRTVAGDKAEVTMLLPPGIEPHSFEPKPEDMVRVSKADVVVFTNEAMEPWAVKMLKTVAGKPVVVDASKGVELKPAAPVADQGHGHEEQGGKDPHIWLDFGNAQIMVQNIADGLSSKDPANRSFYQANAQAYQQELKKLDEAYRTGLSNCEKRVFLHGGHYAFAYLARRYNLRYLSAQAVNPDAEPTPTKIATLVKEMRANGLKYVFCEELLSPATAEMIARETGAKVLLLNGAHNISRQDFEKKVSFLDLMRENLANLRQGLQCK